MKQTQFHGAQHDSEAVAAARMDDLQRIRAALQAAAEVCRKFTGKTVRAERKAGGEPVTAVDRAVNELLFRSLPRDDEGWLSEESADDPTRLGRHRVWIVDPVDGTKEFLAGLPEWCVSVALVEDGQAVAGGVCNPVTGEIFIGSRETGLRRGLQGRESHSSQLREKPLVLASRSEVSRGEWDWVESAPFEVRPVGSIAYKLALVAAGHADATWTFVPKSEWDIAAGVVLVQASGGTVKCLNGEPVVFNQAETKRDGLVAFAACTQNGSRRIFEEWLSRGSKSAASTGQSRLLGREP